MDYFVFSSIFQLTVGSRKKPWGAETYESIYHRAYAVAVYPSNAWQLCNTTHLIPPYSYQHTGGGEKQVYMHTFRKFRAGDVTEETHNLADLWVSNSFNHCISTAKCHSLSNMWLVLFLATCPSEKIKNTRVYPNLQLVAWITFAEFNIWAFPAKRRRSRKIM